MQNIKVARRQQCCSHVSCCSNTLLAKPINRGGLLKKSDYMAKKCSFIIKIKIFPPVVQRVHQTPFFSLTMLGLWYISIYTAAAIFSHFSRFVSAEEFFLNSVAWHCLAREGAACCCCPLVDTSALRRALQCKTHTVHTE